MKKKIAVTISILCIAVALFWAKGYYNERYVAVDSYYTQIPFDEVNEDSWLFDKDGIKQEKGKEYNLVGYNKRRKTGSCVYSKRKRKRLLCSRYIYKGKCEQNFGCRNRNCE